MVSVGAALGMAVATLAVVVSPARAGPGTCQAKNLSTGGVANPDLQGVIDAASPGDTVEVAGVCVGGFTINKNLTVVGRATYAVPQATLDGDGASTVLLVSSDAGTEVTLTNLTITGGYATLGGGIFHYNGRLTLNGSSSVTANRGPVSGAGIVNYYGRLTLNDSSAVTANQARYGGGIYNDEGKVTLNDSSSVSANRARESGGGVFNTRGRVRLTGWSSVTANRARQSGGGGIYNSSRVLLRGSSSVTGNTAEGFGGGIYNFGTLTACDSTGVDEWTGTVSPNTPDDPPVVTSITCV